MKNLYIIVLCFFTISSLHALVPSELCTVDSLDRIYQEISHLDEHTLVVFDRDDTLLQGVDCIGLALRNQFIALWKRIYPKEKITAAYKRTLLHNIQMHQPILVDRRAPALINKLQASGVKVIIMTRGCYGESSAGPAVEDLCIAAFKQVGIDVSQSFSQYSGSVLHQLNHNGYSPLFKKGILFSNTCDKGEALEVFLQLVSWRPSRIVFVDDKKYYVQEVQRAAEKLSIPFLGLHYTGAQKLSAPDLTEQCYRMCYLLDRDL